MGSFRWTTSRHAAVTVETWGWKPDYIFIRESAAVHISRAEETSPRAITICLSGGGVAQPILTYGMRPTQFLPMIMLRLLSMVPRSERITIGRGEQRHFPDCEKDEIHLSNLMT